MSNPVDGGSYAAAVTMMSKALDVERFNGVMALKLVNSVPTNDELRALSTPPFNPNPEGTGTRVNIYV
ncbi:MAG: hypothetical protein L7F77_06905 [Candidatus Magnetominusculus sp. LBB02]|nr:hypothetical protein [Candidatus Magnetominusculus sp. LBB02]